MLSKIIIFVKGLEDAIKSYNQASPMKLQFLLSKSPQNSLPNKSSLMSLINKFYQQNHPQLITNQQISNDFFFAFVIECKFIFCTNIPPNTLPKVSNKPTRRFDDQELNIVLDMMMR